MLRYERLLAAFELRHFPVSVPLARGGMKALLDIEGDPKQEQSLVIRRDRDGEELHRFPFDGTDNTLRTHVGIVEDDNRCTLALFNVPHHQGRDRVGEIYEWQGQTFNRVNPTALESDVLAAMRAHDDTGTWDRWVLYSLLRIPLLLFFYVLIVPLVVARRVSRNIRNRS